jgi:hypothetical protein
MVLKLVTRGKENDWLIPSQREFMLGKISSLDRISSVLITVSEFRASRLSIRLVIPGRGKSRKHTNDQLKEMGWG